MNRIRAIQALNKAELEAAVSPEASWHADYRDTAFIYFGGLPFELSEGDVLTIFSQYGEPVFLKLARDPETGKSRGFGWLKYEDQRSTDLAVDNLCGATIGGAPGAGGRMITVDHARYKPREDEDLEAGKVSWEAMTSQKGDRDDGAREGGDGDDEDDADATDVDRPMLEEERRLRKLIEEHDDEDPMKAFLVEEAKAEVEQAKRRRRESERTKERSDKDRDRKSHRSHHHRHHHHHHHHHRSRHEDDDDRDGRRSEDRSSRRHRDDDSDSRRDDRTRKRHRSSERRSRHDRRYHDYDDEEAEDRHRRHLDDREEKKRRHDRRERDRDRDRHSHDSRSPDSRSRSWERRKAGSRSRSRS